jgi:hypothetical protein
MMVLDTSDPHGQLIDAPTGRRLWSVDPGSEVEALDWSPDGSTLAAVGRRGINGPSWVSLHTPSGQTIADWQAHRRR